MRYRLPLVSFVCISFLFIFCAAELGYAQGIGLRLGPNINQGVDYGTALGFTLAGDFFWVVDDDGLVYLSLQYAPFGLDKEEAATAFQRPGNPEELDISGSGPTCWMLWNCARFRIHDELDEPSFFITGGAGATIITGTEIAASYGTFQQTYEPDLLFFMSGMLGLGLDYPIIDENLALTGQLAMPIHFFGNAKDKGIHIQAISLTVGAEYRVEL